MGRYENSDDNRCKKKKYTKKNIRKKTILLLKTAIIIYIYMCVCVRCVWVR